MRYHVDSSVNQNDCAICIFPIKCGSKKIVKVFDSKSKILFMEALAVLECLRLCKGVSHIMTDSMAVVSYIYNRSIPRNEQMASMIAECRELMKSKACEVIWLDREHNWAGQYLESRLKKIKMYANKMVSGFRHKIIVNKIKEARRIRW